MTTIKFTTSAGGRISSVSVSGHTGLADEGEDILCAAVTSAVRLTECAVNDVLGLEAAVKVRAGKEPLISLKLPERLDDEQESVCQTLLTALMVYFSGLQEEYPENLLVLDTEV